MDRTAYETSIQLFRGENDPRAPFEHSVHIVDKLKEQIQNGKSISGEFISFADEGHGISKEANILYMYNKIE
jgi:dipeptidyl aminopeptidase/acylaminoacyl peptidase